MTRAPGDCGDRAAGAAGVGVAELSGPADLAEPIPVAETAPGGLDGQARPNRWTASSGNARLVAIGLVIVLVGLAAGFVGSLFVPKEFAARAEITYHLMESQPNELLREDRRLTTQLVLLGSRVLLAPVAQKHGLAPEELVEDVSAEVIDNSEIIEVQVRAGTPEEARTLLTDLVSRYLELANKDWENPVRQYLEFQLGEVRTRRRAPDLPPEVSLDLARREQVITSLAEPFRRTTAGGPLPEVQPPANLLTEPYAVRDPVSPKPLIAMAAGGASALLPAALVVLLVARRWSRS